MRQSLPRVSVADHLHMFLLSTERKEEKKKKLIKNNKLNIRNRRQWEMSRFLLILLIILFYSLFILVRIRGIDFTFIHLFNKHLSSAYCGSGIIVYVGETPVNKVPIFKDGNGEGNVGNKQVGHTVCSMYLFLWRKLKQEMRIECAGAKCECCSMAGARVCLACSSLLLSLVSCQIPMGWTWQETRGTVY